MQATYVSRVLAGKTKLPAPDAMQRAIERAMGTPYPCAHPFCLLVRVRVRVRARVRVRMRMRVLLHRAFNRKRGSDTLESCVLCANAARDVHDSSMNLTSAAYVSEIRRAAGLGKLPDPFLASFTKGALVLGACAALAKASGTKAAYVAGAAGALIAAGGVVLYRRCAARPAMARLL